MKIELLIDGRPAVKIHLDLPALIASLQTAALAGAAQSTPASEAQMRDLVSRIDPRSVQFLKAIAASDDGSITWKDMRALFGITEEKDWPAYSGSFGKGITRAYRKVLGDNQAKLVWWNDADWDSVKSWDDDMCSVFIDGAALEALRLAVK